MCTHVPLGKALFMANFLCEYVCAFSLDKVMQRYFNQAKKLGYITQLRHLTILVAGTANVGKTCLLEVLQGNHPPKDHHSTPAREHKKIRITTTKVDVKSDNTWVPVTIKSQIAEIKQCLSARKLAMKDNATKDSITIPKSVYGKKDTTASNENYNIYESHKADETMNTINDQNKYLKAVTEPDHQIPVAQFTPKVKDIDNSTKLTINILSSRDNKTSFDDKILGCDPSNMSSDTWNILSIMDTAGQPEMINLLPVINKLAKITFIVFNMQTLDDPVKDNKNDTWYFSNLNVIECLLSMISCSAHCIDKLNEGINNNNRNDNDKFQVCLVGTHYDKVIDELELLGNIDKKIAHLIKVTTINEVCCVWNRYGSDVYKIDASQNYSKHENKEDDNTKNRICTSTIDVINKMREDINQFFKKTTKGVIDKIPLTWLLLELLILEECEKTNKYYMKREEVTDLIQEQNMEMNVTETNFALKYLHETGVLLYFPEENKKLSNIVFSDPNWLFVQLTKLINITTTGSRHSNKDVQDLKVEGKLNLSLVNEEFKEIDVDVLLALLEHMKIIALMHQEDSTTKNMIYFMPCVLPPCKLIMNKDLIIARNSKAATLHVKFKFGMMPRGVFCCLVVALLERKCIFIRPVEKRYNNLIKFQTTVEGSTVELRDRVSRLEIIVERNCDKDEDFIYYHVQHHVTCALTTVWKNFELSFQNSKTESLSFIQYGFGCNYCKKSVAKFCQFDFKCEDCECNYESVLRDEHELWFVYKVRTIATYICS